MSRETPGVVTDQASLLLDVPANLRALHQLDESNAKIANRIKDIRSVSEKEILACGDALSSIVDKARQLADESHHAVAASVARSEQTTTRFVQAMREDIQVQEAAVRRVLDLTGGMENAIAAINDLTLSSKVLAINARIEAARLGAQGKGFAVIADSLSGLSSVIRAASDTVSSAIEGVRQGLPPVSARAISMRDRTDAFINEVAEQVKSASLQNASGQDNSPLAALTELSNQALSHLQFQDPMSQKLLSVMSDLQAAKDRVRQILSGESGHEASEVIETRVESEPPPGEIMLF
jgi:methyl-accepting chemotaxis protein